MTTAAPTEQAKGSRLREVGLVVVAALLSAVPLWLGTGMVNTRAGGDSPFLLIRVHQLVSNLQAGIFPARWMPDAAYGLGFPFFHYYASLPYYLAAVLKILGLGYIVSIQITQTLGFVLAALAIYGYCRELHLGPWPSLAAAVAYSCAPFHMVNVYVRGDSLSEFYAFVFFPLIAWALLRIQRYGFVRDVAWAALCFAGLWLSHNLSAMIFSPFALAYVVWLTFENKGARLLTLGKEALALILGLAVSAWFWLPVLTERTFVQLKDMTTGYFHFAAHFRGLDLVQPSLWFDYAVTASQQPFRMGLLQAVLAVAGLGALVFAASRRSPPTRSWVPPALLTIAATVMITPLSKILWENLPLLPLVQFPWRFLSIQAVGASVLTGVLVARIPKEKTAALVLSALLLVSALIALRPERLVINEGDVSLRRLMEYEYFTANIGTTIRADYLPRSVDPRPLTSPVLLNEGEKSSPLTLEGEQVTARLVASGPVEERWQITAPSSALLAFHTYYFPNWKAAVDGQPVTLEAIAGLGYIGLRVGPGTHDVRLYFQATRIQSVALLVSTLAFCACLAAIAPGSRISRRNTLILLAAASLLVAALAVRRWTYGTQQSPRRDWYSAASEPLDLTMDFDRSPYLHHNPDGLRFGDQTILVQYQLSAQDVRAGDTLTLNTWWQQIPESFSVQVDIVSPANHLLGVPLSVASIRQTAHGEQLLHALTIPAKTSRGLYLLAVRVFDSDHEILPANNRGESLATTYLVPIRIREIEASEPGESAIRTQFGDRIGLIAAQTKQSAAGQLEVDVAWRASAPPTQNYKTALRLRDPQGWEVARLDTQPGYGFFPTSMWEPGTVNSDLFILTLDAGTPPASHYVLDITLYESSSLQPIGTAQASGIAVTEPSMTPVSDLLQRFGSSLGLQSASLQGETWQPGDRLWLLTNWTALATVDRDLEYRLSLIDSLDAEAASQNAAIAAEYATSRWPEHALVSSRMGFLLPIGLKPGAYHLVVTVLDSSSAQELGSIALPQVVTVVPSQRSFAIPPMQYPVGADFGGQARLLGYDLERGAQKISATVYWQALATTSTDFKLFVHLFDPATERIGAQRDVLAGDEAMPSSTWVPQQVVTQHIEVSLESVPAGGYDLGIGLYYGNTRLAVSAPAGWTVSADRLLLSRGLQVP